jgi:hypothetical protein
MVDSGDSQAGALTEEQLQAALNQLLVALTSLPRKQPVGGYKGKVTPLKVIPLVIGLGADGAYKLMDLREAIDDMPDVVWHDWLKLYGSDFDAEGRRPPESSGKVGVLDILRLIAGGSPAGRGSDLVSILRRLTSR